MYITAQGPCLQNDLYCVEWNVKVYYTIPYRPDALPVDQHQSTEGKTNLVGFPEDTETETNGTNMVFPCVAMCSRR